MLRLCYAEFIIKYLIETLYISLFKGNCQGFFLSTEKAFPKALFMFYFLLCESLCYKIIFYSFNKEKKRYLCFLDTK